MKEVWGSRLKQAWGKKTQQKKKFSVFAEGGRSKNTIGRQKNVL